MDKEDVAFDVAIIGGGPAGLTAGLYAARRGLKAAVIEAGLSGGKLNEYLNIENYPGYEDGSSTGLAEIMQVQAREAGVEFIDKKAVKLELSDKTKKIFLDDMSYKAKAVIIATGGENKKLGVPGESEYVGRGVSYCATCDGPLFQGKTVAVVGGGNVAAEDAAYLGKICEKTYIIHRRGEFRCENAKVQHMRDAGVEFMLESRVMEIRGETMVEELLLESPQGEKTVRVDGVFIAIGVEPNIKLVHDAGIELTEGKFITVDSKMRTSIPGVFAAGDVTGGYMQVATAVGEGCIAALKAYEHVKNPYWTSGK